MGSMAGGATKREYDEKGNFSYAHLSVYAVLRYAAEHNGDLEQLKSPRAVHQITLEALEEGETYDDKNLAKYHANWITNGEEPNSAPVEEENDEEEYENPPLRGVSVLPEPSEVPGPSVREPSVSPSVSPDGVVSPKKRK